ncbi:protein tesmin/TSO1-like CXC 2 isoform X3 [Malania oleifera]|uniref:protein tesmin/TSO1-like CXC 2 isoform X3 n=1 Tax=Malania oleifera TaxID=397392 RepID=UPI0025ADE718|nr:protein tesmin/TSO1-like CXC 2 isoform X3 [Malania oleifera]
MDTPQKDQISTPVSKFEDSPVFNYISSLSPIRPVKSIHTVQTFNSLSFASPPSVFTSPHVSSFKESRLLRRHQPATLSKPDFSTYGNEDSIVEGIQEVVKLSDICAEEPGCVSSCSSTGKIACEQLNAQLEFSTDFPKTLKYDFGSPDGNLMPCSVVGTEEVPKTTGALASLVQFVQDDFKDRQHSVGRELELRGLCRIQQDVAECSSGNLIFDAADVLVFNNSPVKDVHSEGQDQKAVDHGTISFLSTVLQFPQDSVDDVHESQSVGSLGSCEPCESKVPVTHSGRIEKLTETDETQAVSSKACGDGQLASDLSADVNGKGKNSFQSSSKQQRSIRRRCLVFEMAGALKRKSICYSNDNSPDSLQSDRRVAANEQKLISIKSENGYSLSKLPGIGLHLNALATTSKDSKVLTNKVLASGRDQISMPTSISSFTPAQNLLVKSSNEECMQREFSPSDSGVKVPEDSSEQSIVGVNEALNQSSPQKKRRTLEHAGESLVCKRCSCKKSKCLKLYCECFAAGLYCVEPCLCQDCHNNPVHEDTVLETRRQIELRNPLAFAPKVIRIPDFVPEFGEESDKTPASARHKRGCNCKKSSCLKKYCECFQGGVGCSFSCRCDGCKNTFGRKDAHLPHSQCSPQPPNTHDSGGTEEADEGEETETPDKNPPDTVLENNDVAQKGEGEHSDLVPPITPSSKISRSPIQLPFTFTSKPLGSSLLAAGSSPELSTCQKLGKSGFSSREPKFERHLQMIPEDSTPEILKGNNSDCNGVKSASPNCKRVSPPHLKLGPSSVWSSRKLILKSIPSFPSLTPRREDSDSRGKLP